MNATGSTSNATSILLSLGMTGDSGLSGLGGEAGDQGFSSLLSQLMPGAGAGQNALPLPSADGAQTLPPEQQTLPLMLSSAAVDGGADVNDLLGQIGLGLEMAAHTDAVRADAVPAAQVLAGSLKALSVTDSHPEDDSETPDADASAAAMLLATSVPVSDPEAGAMKPVPQSEGASQPGAVASMMAPGQTQKTDHARKPASEPLSGIAVATTVDDTATVADEGAGFLLPGEDRPAAQSLQGQGLSLQGQQGTVQPSPNSGSTLIPPASTAAMTAASTEDNSSASSLVSESGDTLTDTELQAQRLHSSREKLEFGQDRREWGGALGARIMTMVAEDVQKARIQLDPPELGSLEIKLHVSQDQASVQVQAQHAHVREVLEANAHRLRDALAAQGITLNGFDVSERGQGNEGSGQSGDGQGAQGGDDWFAEDGVVDDKPQPQVSSNNLLDTFA